jgi:hypothetical protein
MSSVKERSDIFLQNDAPDLADFQAQVEKTLGL